MLILIFNTSKILEEHGTFFTANILEKEFLLSNIQLANLLKYVIQNYFFIFLFTYLNSNYSNRILRFSPFFCFRFFKE